MRRQSTDPVDLVPLHLQGEKEPLLTLPHVSAGEGGGGGMNKKIEMEGN